MSIVDLTPEAVIYPFPQKSIGLGDYWGWTNYYLQESERCESTININCTANYSQNMINLCKQFIQSSGSLAFTDKASTKKVCWDEAFVKMLPTKIQWTGESNIVAYQFDGIHESELKNPSPKHINFFLEEVKLFGLTPVNIGGHKWLGDCIETMAKAKCLVACPSGMANIARSINVPTCILYNNLPDGRIKYIQEQLRMISDRMWWFKNVIELSNSWEKLPLNYDFTKYRHLIKSCEQPPKKQETTVVKNVEGKNVEGKVSFVPNQDSSPVYRWPFFLGGFGDYWGCTNYFLKVSEECGKTVYVNCGNADTNLINTIAFFIQSSGKIAFTRKKPTISPDWMAAFKEMLPTKILWTPSETNTVAVQFDGRHEANLKNPSIKQKIFFKEKLSLLGLDFVNIGKHKPLGSCIKTLTKAKCLVACPSGMAVVARSVGTPICVLYNKLPPIRVKQLKLWQLPPSDKIFWFKDPAEMFEAWDQLPFNH